MIILGGACPYARGHADGYTRVIEKIGLAILGDIRE